MTQNSTALFRNIQEKQDNEERELMRKADISLAAALLLLLDVYVFYLAEKSESTNLRICLSVFLFVCAAFAFFLVGSTIAKALIAKSNYHRSWEDVIQQERRASAREDNGLRYNFSELFATTIQVARRCGWLPEGQSFRVPFAFSIAGEEHVVDFFVNNHDDHEKIMHDVALLLARNNITSCYAFFNLNDAHETFRVIGDANGRVALEYQHEADVPSYFYGGPTADQIIDVISSVDGR